jgi:uncharacterized protein YecT (DUF1311 family)
LTPEALLERLGLPEYHHALHYAGVVDLASLKALTDSRLRVLGVSQDEHRERILGAIAALRSETPAGLTEVHEAGLTGPVPVDAGITKTQVLVRPDKAALPIEPAPLGDDEDVEDCMSLGPHDGVVSIAVESDDTTDLPQTDHYAQEDEEPVIYEQSEDGALGKLLLFLVVLVVMAVIGGFLVVRSALEAESVSIAPTARSITPAPESAPPPAAPPAVASPRTEPESQPPVASIEPIQPSFPCVKAETRVEQLICGSADLASLDRRLAKAYSVARGTLPNEEFAELRAAQKRWLRSRDACTDQACVSKRYRERLAEVE